MAEPYEKQYEEVEGLIDNIEKLKSYIGQDGAPDTFDEFVQAIKDIADQWDEKNPGKGGDYGDHGDHGGKDDHTNGSKEPEMSQEQ